MSQVISAEATSHPAPRPPAPPTSCYCACSVSAATAWDALEKDGGAQRLHATARACGSRRLQRRVRACGGHIPAPGRSRGGGGRAHAVRGGAGPRRTGIGGPQGGGTEPRKGLSPSPLLEAGSPPRQRLAPGSQTEWQVRRGPVGARAPTEPRGVISRHAAMTSARAPGSSNQTARSAPNAPRHCFLGQTVTPEARGVTGLTDEDEMLEWGVSLK